ncbi:MAG: HAMP domain-containing sensor histidine kinase [Eubacteriales bacterium]|nr:HAMP domain-containing sensor histidine kinase [Eubacteriales bacterium]
MKTIVRSPFAKGIAFALCLLCVVAGCTVAGDALQWYQTEADQYGSGVYRLEGSFEDSQRLVDGFTDAFFELDDALRYDREPDALAQRIEQTFPGEYYAKLGDKVIKNADLTKQIARSSPYYLICVPGSWQSNVVSYYPSNLFLNWIDEGAQYHDPALDAQAAQARAALQEGDCILLRLTEQQTAVLRDRWDEGRAVFEQAVLRCVVLALVLLAAFVYLLCVTGRRAADEDVHLLLIDRLYVELDLALIAGVAIGAAALVLVGLDAAIDEHLSMTLVMRLLTALLVCATALLIELVLSLVRSLKARAFVRRSLVLRVARWCWRIAGRLGRWLLGALRCVRDGLRRHREGLRQRRNGLWQRVFGSYKTRRVLLAFLGYSAVLTFLVLCACADGAFAIFVLVWVAAATVFLCRRVDGFARVVQALHTLRGGDLTVKLTDMPAGVFATMAEDIDSLGDGMQTALQNEVRAERMKSELITNVSHDLKTPLTSILSYADLLCQQHLTPEEANDYAAIIQQKGLRLKNLTSDLFDISKVQSGAEQIVCERLDACTLVRQALGEQDRAIAESGLILRTTIPEHEVPIWADGKKMSRVLENLIGNCVKYALRGTRVFLSVAEQGENVVIEIKNTANYEMAFDAGEITERFVRGDASRSTEGSGLGLAIAKSYTAACGGTLSVEVDGDLFKVRIVFPAYPG